MIYRNKLYCIYQNMGEKKVIKKEEQIEEKEEDQEQ
jgi:hypothetical protein